MTAAAWRSAAPALSAFALASISLRAESPTPDSRPVAAQPISFEENRGQTDPRVKFVSRGADYWLLLAADEATIVRRGDDHESIHMRVKGADPATAITGVDGLPGRIYYATAESNGRLAGASTFNRVKYTAVYPGIDLEYYGGDRQFEFDFTVAPHTDPRQIRLEFAGADRVSLGDDGELRLRLGSEDLLLKAPRIYQEHGGIRHEVSGGYALSRRHGDEVRFTIGRYDPSLPLVIDPTIVYATYSGREGDESIAGTQIMSNGDIYLFGSTTSLPTLASGPAPNNTPVRIYSAPTDPAYPSLYCFVKKISANGTGDPFEVYFEGFRTCEAFAVDQAGEVHLAMQAPYTANGFVQLRTLTDGGNFSAGISVTNLNGGQLSTIAGRPAVVIDMKADVVGNVYLLYKQLVQADSALQSRLMKVDPSGSVTGTFDIGTYSFGPEHDLTGGDSAVAMAIDEFGQVFVAGNTNGNFPVTPNAFQHPQTLFACSQDGFLMQVDTTTAAFGIPYATVLGGSDCDSVLGIVRDPLGLLYVSGRSLSSDFPTSQLGSYARFPNLDQGVGDGFVLKFDLSQSGSDQVVAGTFLNVPLFGPRGGRLENINRLAVLPGGEIAIAGTTAPNELSLLNQIFDATGSQAPMLPFVMLFSADASQVLMSTNLDNSGIAGYALIAGDDTTRNLYAITETTEGDLATRGALQVAPGGGTDLLATKIDVSGLTLNTLPVVDLGPDLTLLTPTKTSTSVVYDLFATPFTVYDAYGFPVRYTWRIDGGAPMAFDFLDSAPVSLALGVHVVTLAVTDNGGATTGDTLLITVVQDTAPVVDAGHGFTVVASSPAGAPVTLYGSVSDQDGDSLTATWTGPFGTQSIDLDPPFDQFNVPLSVELPIGTNVLTLTANDHAGHVVSRKITVVVSGNNTAIGTGVDVLVYDDRITAIYGFTPGQASIHFDNVLGAGLTFLHTRTDQVPPPPTGKQLGSAPYYYDIGSIIVGTGNVRVCIDATGMSFVDASPARLHALIGSVWTDIDTTLPADSANHYVCGGVSFNQALGTFALFTDADFTTHVTTIAGNGAPLPAGNTLPADPGPAPATNVSLDYPQGLALDSVNQFLYVSDSNRIRRVDLQTNMMATIATIPIFGQVAVDRAGNVFLADLNGCGVLRLAPQNNFTSYVSTRVAGLGFDPARGGCGYSGDGGLASAADISDLNGKLAFDSAGNLFIGQLMQDGSGTYAIRRIAAGDDGLITGNDPKEVITTIAGGGATWPWTGNPLDANLGAVYDLSFGAGGDLYLALGSVVARLSPAQGTHLIDGRSGETISTVGAGALFNNVPFQGDGGPATGAQWSGGAQSVAVLPGGDLLVGDRGFTRIRRISAGGDDAVNGGADEVVTTIAGFSDNTSDPPFNGDGFALSTSLSAPLKVLVDPQGGVIVADAVSNRVRHIGVVSAVHHEPLAADLSIGAAASPNSVAVGDALTFVATITNNGPGDATGVATTATLSADAVVTGLPSVGPCGVVGSTINCGPVSIAAGQHLDFSITVMPTAPGTLTATFTVAGQQNDPASGNNIAISSVVVLSIPGTRVEQGGVPYPAPDSNGVDHGITVSFAAVTTPGQLAANPITNPAASPSGYRFVGSVFDITLSPGTVVTPPIQVCFTGVGFTSADRLFHYETVNGQPQWVDHTLSQTPTSVCGVVNSLSPFGIAIPVTAVTPATSAPSTSTIVTINSSAGDQTLPHVSGDLVAYTDVADSRIHYYRFSTGVDAPVPAGLSLGDTLSDVSGDRVVFTRQDPDNSFKIAVFDAGTATVTELPDPLPNPLRLGSAVGGATAAFVDFGTGTGSGDIFTVDLSAPNLVPAPVSLSPLLEQNPNVSPDGNAIVWEQCPTPIECNVMRALRVGQAWAVSPVADTPFNEENPDTDGTWVVYDADRNGGMGQDIFIQPLVGGPEIELALPGSQVNPSVSKGVVGFESTAPGEITADVYLYVIATNTLYRVTSTSGVNESLNDVSVLDNGDVRVVWAADDGLGTTQNIYGATLSLATPTVLTLPPVTASTGHSSTFVATLTSVGAPLANERVRFSLNGVQLQPSAMTDAQGIASLAVEIDLPAGSYPGALRADFDGDGSRALGRSTATADLTVQDTTPPTLVFGAPVPPPNGAGWNRTDVSFAFSASDSGSGVASTSPASPLVVSGSGVGLTGTVVVSDNAGNSATFTSPPVNIDRVAPVVTVPGNVSVSQTTAAGVTVTYAAPVIVETGSGLASSGCAPASGSSFPVGVTMVTCTAADVAGNSGSATFTVTVTATTAPAPNGLMFGVGFINDGRQHDHFIFMVSQLRGHDSGALEFWQNDPTRCGSDDDYSDALHFNGDNTDNYGRSHHNPTAHFEATSITDVTFSDDPAVQPGRSLTGTPTVDTVRFVGVGKWNGRSGYRFEATASDHGEPGRRRDTFSIIIRDASGTVVASVSATIDQGNIESLQIP